VRDHRQRAELDQEQQRQARPGDAPGEEREFGMKGHIDVDADTVLVHTVTCTPASVADVTKVDTLLHGIEKTVHDDAGNTGVAKR